MAERRTLVTRFDKNQGTPSGELATATLKPASCAASAKAGSVHNQLQAKSKPSASPTDKELKFGSGSLEICLNTVIPSKDKRCKHSRSISNATENRPVDGAERPSEGSNKRLNNCSTAHIDRNHSSLSSGIPARVASSAMEALVVSRAPACSRRERQGITTLPTSTSAAWISQTLRW